MTVVLWIAGVSASATVLLLLLSLHRKVDTLMELPEEIAAIKTDLATIQTNVGTIATSQQALRDQVTALQAQLGTPGATITPEQVQALADIKEAADKLVADTAAIAAPAAAPTA